MGKPVDITGAVVEYQEGPGQPWQILMFEDELSHVDLTGVTGGGMDVEARYARDLMKGAGAFRGIGLFPTSNPKPFTGTLKARALYGVPDVLHLNDDVRDDADCSKGESGIRRYSLRSRFYCGEVLEPANFEEIRLLLPVMVTSKNEPNWAKGTTGGQDDVIDEFSITALFKERYVAPKHDNIQKSGLAVAMNKVIKINSTTFVGVSDAVSGTPQLRWTKDKGNTWTLVPINVFSAVDGLDVIKCGPNILVAGNGATPTTGGIAYASWQDIKDGVSTPFTLASGISASHLPNALACIGAEVYVSADDGYIYYSNGGKSFSTLSAGTITTEDLMKVRLSGKSLGYFGGKNGALVKLRNGQLSLVTTGVSDDITALDIPNNDWDRGSHVYIGTDGNDILRSFDEGKTWNTMAFPGDGLSSTIIADLQFYGPMDCHLWVVQTNSSSDSRVMLDLSGGNLNNDVLIIGAFASPSNNGINSIAPYGINAAICVGEPINSLAYIGGIS